MATSAAPQFVRSSPSAASAATFTSPAAVRRHLPLPWDRLESEVVLWSQRALEQAHTQAAAAPYTRLIPRIIQYLSGSQWPARPTAYGNSRPVINRMARQYWELVSLLTDGKPEPQIKVWDTHDGFSATQQLLENLLEPWAMNPDYQDNFQDIIGAGLLAWGVGKIQWNPFLAGGLGDVELKNVNPLLFFKLGGSGPIEECECLIEQRSVTLAALIRRYGDVARTLKPDAGGAGAGGSSLQPMRPSSVTAEQWSKFSPQMQSVLGVRGGIGSTDQLYPAVTESIFWLRDPAKNETSRSIWVGKAVHDRSGRVGRANWGYWVEPGEMLFPRGRVLSVAGGRVMEDTCVPYFHLGSPTSPPGPYVEFLPLRTSWISGAGSGPGSQAASLTGSLISQQDILNRLMAGMLETIKAGLIPTIITPTDAISRGDLDNMGTTISGGKIEYNPLRSGGQRPEFRKQPEFPSAAMTYTQMLMREMDQTTGAAAIDAAAQKEQIPSHDTMEMIQNARSGMVRLMGRRLENFMNRTGQMVIANFLQFYSYGHRTAILGDKGRSKWDFAPIYGSLIQGGMLPEQFVRKFQFSIRPGSALAFDRETRAQLAIVLHREGLISAKNVMRALNRAGANIDLATNEKELAQEALQKLALASLGGAAAKGKK